MTILSCKETKNDLFVNWKKCWWHWICDAVLTKKKYESESISLELEKLENNTPIFRSLVIRSLKTMKNGIINVTDETQAHREKRMLGYIRAKMIFSIRNCVTLSNSTSLNILAEQCWPSLVLPFVSFY